MLRRASPTWFPGMSSSSLEWVWASPPDAALRELGSALERGDFPEPRVLVKQSRARAVWLLPELGLVLKRYTVRGRDAAKARWLPGRAESEYRSMEAFVQLGVPTIRPVAYADRRDGRRLTESWFLCELVPEARTLGEAVAAADDHGRRELGRQALDVVAKLHEHPLYHRDLHAGNVLLDVEGRLLIIDLHSVWRVPRLTVRMRHANLARLLHSLRAFLSLDDAPQLLASYAAQRDERVESVLANFRRGYRRFADDYERGRTARCLRDSTEFEGQRLVAEPGQPGGRLHRRREYELDSMREDLARHASIVADGGDRLLGQQRRNHVTRVGERVVKHYHDGGIYSALRASLGLGRARGAWWAARRCDVIGVPTPRALALLECRDGSAFLITALAPDAVPLDAYLEQLHSDTDHTRRQGVARSLGHLVGRLWRFGLRHSDMSTKNLLVTPAPSQPTPDRRTTPPASWPELQLIDLDGARLVEPYDASALARMLGQLMDVPASVTRSDRLRVLRGFERAAGRGLSPEVVQRAQKLLGDRLAKRARRLDQA
ncbi:MAG: hypothetical protein DHS20C15_01240 [Planctomycetota bacterium]|nr:MAG: hypothetical protein DHS20C15_01240 [Planctomycetota bacterium]